jgi:tetratricopeptide (TPR) repeat protein
MVMWLPVLWVRAEERADTLAATGIAEFNAAYQAWDGNRFGAAAELFRQASTNAPGSCTNFYWLGVAQFHRMLQLRGLPASRTHSLAADSAMDAALAALNGAVKLDERHAESHALLGTLYGMKINGKLLRGARFGPRFEKHRKAAMESGADNPRVWYLLATCQFHTANKPPAWREVLTSFLAAEKLFTAEAERPAGPLDPRWGFASCLTFIGRIYGLFGQRTEAADYFRKALAIYPQDHVAQAALKRVAEQK